MIEIILDNDKHYKTYTRYYYTNEGKTKKPYIYKKSLCDVRGCLLSCDGERIEKKKYNRIITRSDKGGKHKIPESRKTRKDKGIKRLHYVMINRKIKENLTTEI